MSALLCMGREIEFDLKSGETIVAPPSAGMLFDETGTAWPKCSLLVKRFEDGTSRSDRGKDYFGRKASVYEGHVELPMRALSTWKRRGEIKAIFYERAGTKLPGFFRHVFNKPRGLYKVIFWIKGRTAKTPAILYARGKDYRVELPDGCIVDDRGIVLP